MYCEKCGHKVKENDFFCTKCGHRLKRKQQKEKNKKDKQLQRKAETNKSAIDDLKEKEQKKYEKEKIKQERIEQKRLKKEENILAKKENKFIDSFTNESYHKNYKYRCPVCENTFMSKKYLSNGSFNGEYICKNCIEIINAFRGGERPGTVFLNDLKSIVADYYNQVEKFKNETIPDELRITYGPLLDTFDALDVETQLYILRDNHYFKNFVSPEIYSDIYRKNKSKEFPNNYVVFDTETTGLDPSIDKIIEISAIKYHDGEQIDTFSFLINPEIQISNFITELTGIANSDLIDKPLISEILPKFFEFIEDYTLVAHNISYDIQMIACECYRNNIEMCSNKLINTVYLARRMIPKNKIENYKLPTLKNYYGIKKTSHRAMADCEVCNYVYQEYLKFHKIKNRKTKTIIVDIETGEILQEH